MCSAVPVGVSIDEIREIEAADVAAVCARYGIEFVGPQPEVMRTLGNKVAARALADAIAHGDLPGISTVIVDGEVIVSGRSRQTPPPTVAPAAMARICRMGAESVATCRMGFSLLVGLMP